MASSLIKIRGSETSGLSCLKLVFFIFFLLSTYLCKFFVRFSNDSFSHKLDLLFLRHIFPFWWQRLSSFYYELIIFLREGQPNTVQHFRGVRAFRQNSTISVLVETNNLFRENRCLHKLAIFKHSLLFGLT